MKIIEFNRHYIDAESITAVTTSLDDVHDKGYVIVHLKLHHSPLVIEWNLVTDFTNSELTMTSELQVKAQEFLDTKAYELMCLWCGEKPS